MDLMHVIYLLLTFIRKCENYVAEGLKLGSDRAASLQMGPEDLLEFQRIARVQRSVPLKKIAV